jgi:hypothetical protein
LSIPRLRGNPPTCTTGRPPSTSPVWWHMFIMLACFELLTQPDGSYRRRCCGAAALAESSGLELLRPWDGAVADRCRGVVGVISAVFIVRIDATKINVRMRPGGKGLFPPSTPLLPGGRGPGTSGTLGMHEGRTALRVPPGPQAATSTPPDYLIVLSLLWVSSVILISLSIMMIVRSGTRQSSIEVAGTPHAGLRSASRPPCPCGFAPARSAACPRPAVCRANVAIFAYVFNLEAGANLNPSAESTFAPLLQLDPVNLNSTRAP